MGDFANSQSQTITRQSTSIAWTAAAANASSVIAMLRRVISSVRAAPQAVVARFITTGPIVGAGTTISRAPRAPLPARRSLCDAAAALEEQYAKPLQWMHWLYAAGSCRDSTRSLPQIGSRV